MDFLCEFCQVVIMKLKERQAMENDFEQKVRNECINYSKNSSSLCDVVNRVNLDRLKTDDSKKICKTQQMCNDQSGATTHEPGPPSASPEQQISQRKPGDEPERIDIDEKRLNATLHVEDISSYN
uniref:Saposin B-type domain-containing protein n=1 Tax=Caenorhabditis tropicalis TaxID=1561998 RepID=A0A1I7TFY7_9PELO